MEAALAADLKRKALLYLLLALLVTFIIGLALPRLQFQPGMPLPSFENGEVVVAPAEAAPVVGMAISDFLKILFGIIMAVLAGVLIYRLVKGVNWREALKSFFSFMTILLVLFGVIVLILTLLPKTPGTFEGVPMPTPVPIARAPLGPTPPLLIWIVGIALLVAAVLVGVWLVRAGREAPPEMWAIEIGRARQALLDGADLKDVILRCYQQMSSALQEDQDIERPAYMTTGDFVRVLAAKGVPETPVQQLTRLFDAVRYGHWQPRPGDEQRALDSLNAILAYSHATRKAG
jgi:hypothetical protein